MLGIPFYGYGWSAVVIGVIVLIALWFGLNYKHTVDKKRVSYVSSRAKNTTLLCMLMLMIGYSSYALIVIRSAANPPMDQNSPEDIFTLGNYLSRDQYGDRPLLYGQAYTSQVALKVDGSVCKYFNFASNAIIILSLLAHLIELPYLCSFLVLSAFYFQ